MTSRVQDKISEFSQEILEELSELSKEIYERPELGLEEYFACQAHVNLLSKYGFEVVENYLGYATGFRASYQSDKPGPSICFMAEYDALPEIGHGCGHNILGATSSGAGIVLKQVLDELGGQVVVLGTPAEETSGAKVKYAEEGAFDDIDVAMIVHPNTEFSRSGGAAAMEAIKFQYFGRTAHAASCPEKGLNALDGVINTFNNINSLRQQMASDARVHGIISQGGEAPNIIPDYCEAKFYVRSLQKSYLIDLIDRVKTCAKAGAQAAGVELKISNFELSYDNMMTNQHLDQAFAESLYAFGLAKEDLKDAVDSYGSIDAGNVSQVCPTIHPYFAISNDQSIAGHTREFAQASLSDLAQENMLLTVRALALTGARIIEDESLLAAIKDEFDQQLG